jgi:DNA-binding MarR family transcriptional regulator
MPSQQPLDEIRLEAQITAFIRAFGLLQPDRTPCGQPIPVSEAHALVELDRDGPLAQHELGARLRLEKSTISRLVDQLERRGWLTAGRRDGDGRVVWLELTEAGRTAAAELAAARAARFAELLEAIPAGNRRAVLDGLATLVEAARAHP